MKQLFIPRSLYAPQVDCLSYIRLRLGTLNRTIGSIYTQSRLHSKLLIQSRVYREVPAVSRS